MEITHSEEKKYLDLYKDLIYYYFNNQKRDMNYDDKPYTNFLSGIHKIVSKSEYYDSDLMEYVIDNHLSELNEVPEKFEVSVIKELIERTIKIFAMNAGEHYLIIPIPKARLENIVQFNNYTFIPREWGRSKKIETLCSITDIPLDELEDDVRHTEVSRSPDFMKYNLLVIKIKNQTPFVSYNAELIAKYCIYFLRVIYFSEIHKITDSLIRIFRFSYDYRENSHLSILSKESWRKRHSTLNFETECDFDLDFIAEVKYQEIFLKFVNEFIFNLEIDELSLKFLNSIVLFNRSYEQSNDDSLKLLLLITAGESLLTQNKNEKKLRLTALLSRLVKVENSKPYEIAKIIQELYLKRNDFVHAGKKVYLPYKSKEDGLNELNVLRHMIAKTLVNYINVYNDKLNSDENKNRYQKWIDYLDSIFDQIITGEELKLDEY